LETEILDGGGLATAVQLGDVVEDDASHEHSFTDYSATWCRDIRRCGSEAPYDTPGQVTSRQPGDRWM
ncbi:MAG TPA: hypothetical protein VNP95_04530, partial [Thermomicrobiales bacterium]|nr:hypothetical protein [Thermomicrobiales bacterium]